MIARSWAKRLNIGSVLTWGPDYYYQKQFFSAAETIRFRSPIADALRPGGLRLSLSHAGHIVLLSLKEQDYPGTKRSRTGRPGTCRSSDGRNRRARSSASRIRAGACRSPSKELPTYEMPGFDGIGANEYIVDVTQPDTVDFISAVDTPYVWELNIWYHTLNVGFRTRIAGRPTSRASTTSASASAAPTRSSTAPLSYRRWLEWVAVGPQLRLRRQAT